MSDIQKFLDDLAKFSAGTCSTCPHFKWKKQKTIRTVKKFSINFGGGSSEPVNRTTKKKVATKPYGTCHANLPGDNTPVGCFPIVEPDDWCPQHPDRSKP